MLQREHSAILSTCIKLLFVIKIFVLSILSGRFARGLLYCVLTLDTGSTQEAGKCPNMTVNVLTWI